MFGENRTKIGNLKYMDISAATLHILAMVWMLMDHLWAILLPAQDWLTCIVGVNSNLVVSRQAGISQ